MNRKILGIGCAAILVIFGGLFLIGLVAGGSLNTALTGSGSQSKREPLPALRKPPNTPVLGRSRDAPLPVGQTVLTHEGWEITATEFNGDATQRIKEAKRFNSEPTGGQKYVTVHIQGVYNGKSETGRLSPADFRLVGKKGTIYESASVALAPKLESNEVFKGVQVAGYIAYKVAADDSGFRLIISTALGEGLYLAVE